METPVLIGLDWGTSSLRAYLLAASGEVIDQRWSAAGILAVDDGGFSDVLHATVGGWLNTSSTLPIIASGMVGSRAGWREVPYVAAPAGLQEIARGAVSLPFASTTVWLLPGLAQRPDKGTGADVIRGEETQVLGVVSGASCDGMSERLWVLPGTHSKWVTTRAETITSFATFFTGELFASLSTQGTLGQVMSEPSNDASEARGFARGLETDGRFGLLGRLFSVRAEVLLEQQPAEEARGYLSGLLLGAEMDEARVNLDGSGPVGLIVDGALRQRYAQALRSRGFEVDEYLEPAAPQGLLRLAVALGLVQ